MRLVDVLATLGSMDAMVFTTREAAARLGVSNVHASVLLARLAAAGPLARLRRGVWAVPGAVDPLALPECLTALFPAYVSLQSALYLHGMISQMPAVTYAVTLARTRRFVTPFGVASLHHVQPSFFFGFEGAARPGARLATLEKALADFQYLRPARSRLFSQFAISHPLARLGKARAAAMAGDLATSRTAYQDFLTWWKDADPDLPVLIAAKAEYEKLQQSSPAGPPPLAGQGRASYGASAEATERTR